MGFAGEGAGVFSLDAMRYGPRFAGGGSQNSPAKYGVFKLNDHGQAVRF